MVRTVTGASASYNLQTIFPLSVSIVQYRPGFRAGAAGEEVLKTSAATSALSNNLHFIFRINKSAPWKLSLRAEDSHLSSRRTIGYARIRVKAG